MESVQLRQTQNGFQKKQKKKRQTQNLTFWLLAAYTYTQRPIDQVFKNIF